MLTVFWQFLHIFCLFVCILFLQNAFCEEYFTLTFSLHFFSLTIWHWYLNLNEGNAPLYEFRSSIKQWFFTFDWPRPNSVRLSCPFLPVEKKKKNPPLWCCLVFRLMYSSLLILQSRCFFFQWKVLTGEIFKVVLKANKLF